MIKPETRPGPQNIDRRVVAAFGEEWKRFPQQDLANADRERIFADYFSVFPWDRLPPGAVGVDIGCGSGRWAMMVAPRVGHLHLVDASEDALEVARHNLPASSNVSIHQATVDELPFADGTLDFAYSLGVLHHVPDTAAAIRDIGRKLRSGAPFLVYLYYAFDNRPLWYRLIWKLTEFLRHAVSRLAGGKRYMVSQVIAILVYWPLARLAWLLDRAGILPATWPLAYYRDKTFYVMRTDALDRFGTRLEHRFSQDEIRRMLESAGFGDVVFRDGAPYWCAVGIKK